MHLRSKQWPVFNRMQKRRSEVIPRPKNTSITSPGQRLEGGIRDFLNCFYTEISCFYVDCGCLCLFLHPCRASSSSGACTAYPGVYFLAGKLGLSFAFEQFKPRRFGRRQASLWLQYSGWGCGYGRAFFRCSLGEPQFRYSFPRCSGIASGNTLEAVITGWMILRASGPFRFAA